MNFSHYFNNRFAGCRLIAEAYDHCRLRDVKIYLIPGQVDCVGVCDTVDRWIAPVAPDLFTVDIQQVLRDIFAGKDVKLPVRAPALIKQARRPLILEPPTSPPESEPAPPKRRALITEPAVPSRRKLLN